MGKFIFIFINIIVVFLTIVSKTSNVTFSIGNHLNDLSGQLPDKDTIKLIFSDDFESGSLRNWKLTTDWELSSSEKISGSVSLKHAAKATSGSSAVFKSINTDFDSYDYSWSFRLKNGNWDPSSTNKFWFYLSADTILTSVINGHAIGVNVSGTSDLLQLWRIKNGKADSLIVQTDLDWNESTLAAISAQRTSRGEWTVGYQLPDGQLKTFYGNDRIFYPCRNVGLQFIYTATRAGQLWFDDLKIKQMPSAFYSRSLTIASAQQLVLTFNKAIDPATVQPANFKLTNENNQEIQILKAKMLNESSIELNTGKVSGTELSLIISGISDLSGQLMKPEIKTFSNSFSPETGSVLINELLFNPFSGGVDFVELINNSEQTIPVHRLKLASRNDTLALKQVYSISTEKRFLNPGQFLVCTKDLEIVQSQYFSCDPKAFCSMKTLPSFPDDAGTVVLLNDSLQVLDEFSYSAKMHSPFLADENGVSLERISLKKPTSDRNNWASASASVGFATPGLPNSQTESENEIQDGITPEPKAFSPNGDGYNDELNINYQFGKPGYIANVRIFDAAGRLVRFLAKNESLAQEGNWLWDGKSESGQKQSIGVYIILVEVFDQEGHTKAFKKACTLTDRLN